MTSNANIDGQETLEEASDAQPASNTASASVPTAMSISKQLALQRVFGVPNGIDFMAAQSEAGFRITFGN